MAFIGFMDTDRLWLKAKVGLNITETPRDIALCAHTIMQPDALLMVPDLRQDPRFADNPLVNHDPPVHSYSDGQLRNWQVYKFPLQMGNGRILSGMAVGITENRALPLLMVLDMPSIYLTGT